MAVLVVLFSFGVCDPGCFPGVQSLDQDDDPNNWSTGSDAFVKRAEGLFAYEYFLGLRGSFIPYTTGSFTFYFRMKLTSVSVVGAEIVFWQFGNTGQQQFTANPDHTEEYTQELTAGWRYKWELRMMEEVKNVELEVRVTRPDGINKRLDTTDSETCFENAHPTVSKSPSPTRSSQFRASAACSSSAVFDASRPAGDSSGPLLSLGFIASRNFTTSSSFTSRFSYLDRRFRVFRLMLFSFADIY
jgi:hypothetical protein